MKKASVTIGYDDEKLSALRLFLSQKSLDLDAELEDFLDALFKKHVPAPVREFLELRDTPAPPRAARPAKRDDGSGKPLHTIPPQE